MMTLTVIFLAAAAILAIMAACDKWKPVLEVAVAVLLLCVITAIQVLPLK